jgi:hypothetical protein
MEEPLRYQRTFKLNAGQLDKLEAHIDDIPFWGCALIPGIL